MDLVSGRLGAVTSRQPEGAPPHRGPATKATPGAVELWSCGAVELCY